MALPLSLGTLHERKSVEHETLCTCTARGIIGTPMDRKNASFRDGGSTKNDGEAINVINSTVDVA